MCIILCFGQKLKEYLLEGGGMLAPVNLLGRGGGAGCPHPVPTPMAYFLRVTWMGSATEQCQFLRMFLLTFY